MNFFEKVHYVCSQIPSGRVASYGQIAAVIGSPKAARQVGWALNKSPEHLNLPAHRVVNRQGVLSGAGAFALEKEQEARLKAEGIPVTENRVDISKYGWRPEPEELIRIKEKVTGSHLD